MWILLEARHLNSFKNSFKETDNMLSIYIIENVFPCGEALFSSVFTPVYTYINLNDSLYIHYYTNFNDGYISTYR